MKNLLTLSLVALSVSTINAQEVKFGKFTDQEITKNKSNITETASAEILYSYAKHKIDFNQNSGDVIKTTTIHYRIKVYDKDKTQNHNLTVEIPIRRGASKSDTERLLNVKASTFNPDTKGLKEIKVEKKDIFSKKIHDYLDVQTLTFPNVQNGSILEYTYEIASPFYNSTDTWYFQEDIPVVKSDFILETNEVLKYQEDFRGLHILQPKTSTKKEVVNYKQGGANVNEFHLKPVTTGTYEYNLESKKFTAENLPAIEKEAYVLNPRNLLTSIKFELTAYMPKNGTHTLFTTTWDRIGKDLMDHEDFGRQLNGNGFLDDKVSELINGKTSESEKIISIFNFVKTNFKWNDYRGIYTDKGLRKVFNEKTGNVAEINLLLIAMLQKAGIKANPVVLSTVQNGLLNYTFPSRTRLDYVIATAKVNGNDILLDATEFYSTPNIIPMRALNHRGIVIEKEQTREINLTNNIQSSSKTQITATLDTEGKFKGSYQNTRDNYFYMNDKSEIAQDPKAFEKEYLEDYSFDIEDFKSTDNNNGMIRHSFKFNDVQTDVAGNKIIFNPLLFTAIESHQLNAEKRTYNLEFGAPMELSKVIRIKIPDGYKVESLPKSSQYKIVNDAAGYIYKIEEKEGYIVTSVARHLPYSILPPDYYLPFKEMMNKVVEAETQQVILVKE